MTLRARHGLRRPAVRALAVVAAIAALQGPSGSPAWASAAACGPTWAAVPASAGGATDLLGITTAPGGTVWAVGAAGTSAAIEEQTPSGWVSMPANAPGGSVLNSVTALAADDIWAVGMYSLSGHWAPLIEHWDGTAWAQVASPSAVAQLRGVYGAGPGDVWAVGVQAAGNVDQTFIEHWDGSTWSVVPSPNVGQSNNWLTAVSGDSASSVWAVGWHGGGGHQTLAEHWDGTRWQVVPTPDPAASGLNVLQDVADVSATDVWAIGFDGGGVRSTLAENWDGTSWRAVATPNGPSRTSQLIGLGALGPGDVWAVGEYYAHSGWRALAENWDGSSWATTTMPPSPGSTPDAVALQPDGSAWTVGQSAPTTGGLGQSWQLCPVGVADSGFMPAAIASRPGQTVAWLTDPAGGSGHTVTDGPGLGLFDSGPLAPGTSVSFGYFAAGTYPVTDAADQAGATVKVPMTARPSSGTVSTSFALTWAAQPAPSSYVYDVQVKLPGATGFIPFATGVTAAGQAFTPAAGAGTYRFEARLRAASNGAASAWSPPRAVSVTAGSGSP